MSIRFPLVLAAVLGLGLTLSACDSEEGEEMDGEMMEEGMMEQD
ncbi:hypothetical protein [Lutibaculum baratangense]|uniref:Uncharacterized protein n=1 Tax=Lutibaculum baratangense AMV1 TaxID=631454 RepID=V4R698_9HYPH|nr:hypothetical protein [Lutibaculum baratangense]ESR27457.1 hypothetical protein N177_0061 [Lutibaculum baratangense AMV1]